MSTIVGVLLIGVFLLLAGGVWIGGTTAAVGTARWPELQSRYPATDEVPWLTLRWRWVEMTEVRAQGSLPLTLSACPSGLRVAIISPFAAGTKPFTVPWNEIHPDVAGSSALRTVTLSFGEPRLGLLRLAAQDWQRLAARSPLVDLLPAQALRESGLAMLLYWALGTLIFGSFFSLVWLLPGANSITIPQGFVFAALVFGVPMLIRWLRRA